MLEKNNYQNNIKQFRVREGLTQEELAKKKCKINKKETAYVVFTYYNRYFARK